jgi:hypothetical protein
MTLRVFLFGAACLSVAGAAAAQVSPYTVGQKVEIEASGHWVPCTVSDIQAYAGLEPLIRVQCAAYPALSRAAGTYIVHNNQTGIRPATGRIGPAPAAAPAGRPAPAGPGSALKVGEYACYGSGGRPMIGLAFKVLPGGAYTDLDGKSRGTYAVAAGTVRFKGGHLDGQSGRELDAKGQFRIGAMASCEPW